MRYYFEISNLGWITVRELFGDFLMIHLVIGILTKRNIINFEMLLLILRSFELYFHEYFGYSFT